jgi:protein-tyrosine phosphatase
MSPNYSILFVCLGNICRSPAAAGIFAKLAKKYDEDQAHKLSFHIDSCAVGKWSLGQLPDERMVEACHKKGFEICGKRSRLIQSDDFEAHDYIFSMDHSIQKKVLQIAPKKVSCSIELFTKYSERYPDEDVPDPYYGSVEAFDAAVSIIEDASIGLLKYFLQQEIKK